MIRIRSLLQNHLPALMLAVYTFSFWILPQDWNEDNILDGSWRYALGMFRKLGFSLGKDSWFTYGPLAHWFGAPMGTEQFQPFPYYVLGLFVAGIIGISFSRILVCLELSFPVRIFTVLIFPLCFFGMDDSPELFLIIALFLLLLSCCLQEKPDNFSVISMIMLSACGLLYKFSFGILSSFTLVVLFASLIIGKRISARKLLFCLAGYVTLLYAMFVATSGSFHLCTYLILGLETSGKYSEIMTRNMPYSPAGYIVALVYLVSGSVLAWLASKRMVGAGAALCLIISYLGAMLLLFKHGFVRADFAHIKLFYGSVTSINAMLALTAFTRFNKKSTGERVLLCSAALVLLVIYAVMIRSHHKEINPANFPKNWLTCGNRIVAGIQGQSPARFQAKKEFVRNSQPQLFSWLNDYSRSNRIKRRKPRITFYPWELMFFEGVEGFDLAPSPSLQLYSTGPHSQAHRKEAGFLESGNRPDIVVIGPGSIDDRSPVSELTDLLLPLYAHYQLIAVVEGFNIFEAHEGEKSSDAVIRCTGTPQGAAGEFLRISLDQPDSVNRLYWRLAATFFKSPELYVVVTITYVNNEKIEYGWRGYVSQLQDGVYISPLEMPDFFCSSFRISATMPHPLPRTTVSIKSAVAELRRSSGFWNLPVIPQVVPLKVRFCSFM
jgi:hypothetical protein